MRDRAREGHRVGFASPLGLAPTIVSGRVEHRLSAVIGVFITFEAGSYHYE